MSPRMPRPIIVAETLPRVNTRSRPRNAPGRRGAPKLQPGTVQIYCADPPRGLIVLLGVDPVKLTGGGGGWEQVTRPHQTSMTLWQGSEPWGLQLPLMLDDYAERGGVERAMRVLSRLVKGDDDSEPGVVEIGGIPLPSDEWIIESIDYGDPIRGVTDMRLLAAAVHAHAARVRAAGIRAAAPAFAPEAAPQDEGRHGQEGRHAGEDRPPPQVQVDGAARAQPENATEGAPEGGAARQEKGEIQGRRQNPGARQARAPKGRGGGGRRGARPRRRRPATRDRGDNRDRGDD